MVHVVEIQDINSSPVLHLNNNLKSGDDNVNINETDRKSVNFGGGVELLMNDKLKSDSKSLKNNSDIGIGDLNDLEAELNNLSSVSNLLDGDIKSKSKSGMFNDIINGTDGDNIKIDLSEPGPPDTTEPQIPLGKSTAGNPISDESFKKFSNIPIDPDKIVNQPQKLSGEELLREKFGLLRKLEALESKGIKLTKKYSMESNFQEMKGEYEMIVSEKEKSNSIKFQGKMIMAAITGVEFLNSRFDPFDIKLDGWSEQLNENIDDYDEIFGELHDKYKSKAKMAPELKLMFQMAGSAIMVHMTNTMFKSAMPGMDDIMRQNPELMQQFTQAAVNTMGEQNPGFGGFMDNIMGGAKSNQREPDSNPFVTGPPPVPMKTRVDKSVRAQVPANRPDMSASRGDYGVDITNNFESVGHRSEMKGPSDISSLLSNIKTKTVSVPGDTGVTQMKDGSTVSVQDLKDLQNANIPSRSNRRKKSEKTSISLDI
jgi:hypothetical protein